MREGGNEEENEMWEYQSMLIICTSTVTSSLSCFLAEDTDEITPTIGFANASLTFGRHHVTMYDVGGGPRIRGIWKNYYAEVREGWEGEGEEEVWRGRGREGY